MLLTHRGAAIFKFVAVIGTVLLVAAIGIYLLRSRRRLASKSQPAPTRRKAPTAYSPRQAPTGPDVLDRVRMAEAAATSFTPITPVPAEARPDSWSLKLIRELEWKRFEELNEGYWKAKGYRAELTGRGADGGIDVNLYRPSAPDKLLAVIQCKSRSHENIGVAIVRELYGVMHHVGAPMGILVTSSGFHAPAREFAAGKHLQLMDGEALCKQLAELPEAESRQLLGHVIRGDYITPTCPSCDVKMVRKPGKNGRGDFYGCGNFPRCRLTFQVRAT